jgi:hypothetical protein
VILAGIAQSMRITVGDPLFKASSGRIKGYKRRLTILEISNKDLFSLLKSYKNKTEQLLTNL